MMCFEKSNSFIFVNNLLSDVPFFETSIKSLKFFTCPLKYILDGY